MHQTSTQEVSSPSVPKRKVTNSLHELRMKEQQLLSSQRKNLASNMDRNLERKRLSSAYSNPRKDQAELLPIKTPREVTVSPVNTISVNEDEEDRGDDALARKFHYVHIKNDDITVTKAFSRATTASSSNRNAPVSHTYFVPSLVELSATVVAKHFTGKFY